MPCSLAKGIAAVGETHHFSIDGKVWLVRITRLRGSADGWTIYADESKILIDEGVWKQGNRASLELLIHEVYHALNPQYDETVVERHAKDMARLLWKMGLRFTEE